LPDGRLRPERVGTSTSPDRQFVWGLRLRDDLVLRDRDANGTGTLNERMFALEDPLGSIAAIVDSTGVVQERYAYSPYGLPMFLTLAFARESGPLFDLETLFAGYRYDLGTSLSIVRERILQSATGFWLTRDPLGIRDTDGFSLYEYATARPLDHVDPLGLQCFSLLIMEETCPRPMVEPALIEGGTSGFRIFRPGSQEPLPPTPEPPGQIGFPPMEGPTMGPQRGVKPDVPYTPAQPKKVTKDDCRRWHDKYFAICKNSICPEFAACWKYDLFLAAIKSCYTYRQLYINVGCDKIMPTSKDHPGQIRERKRQYRECVKRKAQACDCNQQTT
jgi:RHS repeat-associated protein